MPSALPAQPGTLRRHHPLAEEEPVRAEDLTIGILMALLVLTEIRRLRLQDRVGRKPPQGRSRKEAEHTCSVGGEIVDPGTIARCFTCECLYIALDIEVNWDSGALLAVELGQGWRLVESGDCHLHGDRVREPGQAGNG